MRSSDLDHRVFRDPQVNFYVSDVEKSVAFYSNLFGFRETFRTPTTGDPIHVELRLGSLVLGLGSIESLLSIHGIDIARSEPRAEIVLWTDNVDEDFQELESKGVKTLSPPHDFISTVRGAWLADPDGYAIQIVQRKQSTQQ
jgi:catechol 2,3-dioxygenase-like lactoylglutathione lyase family enzyme